MQKWEYCATSGFTRNGRALHTHNPAIWRFLVDGYQMTEIKGEWEKEDELAKVIATLGEEGWEMVGCGNTDEVMHALYFKRPKP